MGPTLGLRIIMMIVIAENIKTGTVTKWVREKRNSTKDSRECSLVLLLPNTRFPEPSEKGILLGGSLIVGSIASSKG